MIKLNLCVRTPVLYLFVLICMVNLTQSSIDILMCFLVLVVGTVALQLSEDPDEC